VLDTLVSPVEDQEQSLAATGVQEKLKDSVREAVGELDDRERYIVENRLMADPEDELSLAELGRRLGVSRERARQLEARAKKKLRGRLQAISRDTQWDPHAVQTPPGSAELPSQPFAN
jgi:RNA polymerase sigma-32 factor